MAREPGYTVWLPLLVTISMLFVVVFAAAWLSSNTWADLLGLFYVMVSPFVYGTLQSLVSTSTGRDVGRERISTGDAGQ